MNEKEEREYLNNLILHFFTYGRVKKLTIEELKLIYATIKDKML